MTFYSLTFLAFFLVASIAIHFVPNTKWQHRVFLTANIVFYAYWDYRFLLLLAFVILVCYLSGILFEKKQKTVIIVTAVVICLSVLVVCKYLNFFIETFTAAFHIQDSVTLNIILPLGVSFYIFQSISYLADLKKNKIQAEHDFVKFASYISFFPQITSGPIVKAHDFLPQMETLHRIKKENVYRGCQLFLIGLTKKLVIADRIGIAVNAVYEAPLAYNWLSTLFAVLGYSIQIYCDFSGYSDMAIGIAVIWDFDLGKNFNAPYIATNPSDFWRRWHISLSSWFRDYVYIPLGGNRKGKIRTYFNLFITMVLSGLWHGANITYIVWGCIHGFGSIVHKFWKEKFKRETRSKIGSVISIIITFIFVSLAWIVFRANSLEQAGQIFSALFKADGISFVNVYTVCYLVLLTGFNIAAHFLNKRNAIVINMDLDRFRNKVMISVWIFLIIMLMYVGNSSFIYAQF